MVHFAIAFWVANAFLWPGLTKPGAVTERRLDGVCFYHVFTPWKLKVDATIFFEGDRSKGVPNDWVVNIHCEHFECFSIPDQKKRIVENGWVETESSI